MSLIDGFRENLAENCRYDNSWFEFALGAIQLTPFAFSVGFSFIANANREVYYAVYSGWGWLNIILNYAVSNVVRSPVPLPKCGEPSGLPVLFVEHAYFMLTFLSMSCFRFGLDMGAVHTCLLHIWGTLVWMSCIVLGYNFRYQVVWSAYVGVACGLFAIVVTEWCILPYLQWFLGSDLNDNYFGFRDTIFSRRFSSQRGPRVKLRPVTRDSNLDRVRV